MCNIKIVLADDHALIRAGYKSILEDVEDISSLDNTPGVETLNVSKIVDKGNGSKEISILTDISEEKKEEEEESTKKTIRM